MSHDDAKDRLIAAAGPLFAERGYEGTTVRQIIEAAGVNLASVNYHFGDKRRLYIETVNAAFGANSGEVTLPEATVEMSPEKALRGLIDMIAQHLLKSNTKPWQIRLITREMIQPSEVGREIVEKGFRPFFNLLLDVVSKMVPPETPLFRRQLVVFSIVGQCVYHRNARDVMAQLVTQQQVQEKFTPDVLAQHIYEFSLGGIRELAGSGAANEIVKEQASPPLRESGISAPARIPKKSTTSVE